MNETVIHHYASPIVHTISSAVEIVAALLIGVAVLYVVKSYLVILSSKSAQVTQRDIRIKFGSTIAVALELLLGADILATAMAPTWDEIGKLAAIATVRTALNFFLEKDLESIEKSSA